MRRGSLEAAIFYPETIFAGGGARQTGFCLICRLRSCEASLLTYSGCPEEDTQVVGRFTLDRPADWGLRFRYICHHRP